MAVQIRAIIAYKSCNILIVWKGGEADVDNIPTSKLNITYIGIIYMYLIVDIISTLTYQILFIFQL